MVTDAVQMAATATAEHALLVVGGSVHFEQVTVEYLVRASRTGLLATGGREVG